MTEKENCSMNKRHAKACFGERGSSGSLFFEWFRSWRSVPSALILLAFALFPCARAEGAYANWGNDRVLLMNNDSRLKKEGRIENQGYYDTNSTIGVTYWTHEPKNDNTATVTRFLLHGTNHVLHAANGTPLWHLVDCRAGYVATGSTVRNHIPWSTLYAQKSEPPVFREGTIRYYTNEVNACVMMRNTAGATVYSPSYDDGIGTIYFDIVNSFTTRTDSSVVLEIATNVTDSAAVQGFSFSTVGADYDKLDWHRIPMTVLSIMDNVIESTTENVESLLLNATEGGTRHYFRVRSKLNHYGPIKFRIRRESYYPELVNTDADALIALDNIIVSYPPMTIRLERYGEDYDDSLLGANVLGCMGDFNVPFQSAGQEGVLAKVKISWVTNNVNEEQRIEVKNPKFHYRWRYLNQIVDDWQTLDLLPSVPSYLVDSSATQLVTATAIPLNRGVGDLEYYFTADLDAQYYSVRDYANDVAVGYGDGWTEAITAVTNRATYAAMGVVPSGGTDYFTRIREGESNMEWVQLIGTLTITNRVAGSNEVVKVLTPDGTVPRMTLEGDHSWRYHYAVPANAIGGKLSFKIVTKEYYTNETAATSAAAPAWLIRTNELGAAEGTVAELPFTATLHSPGDPDVVAVTTISVDLDDSSTHLKIEYNDERREISISHASYQSFNLWTDARDGFRCSTMFGASDHRLRYDAPFDSSWELCPELNLNWREDFDSSTSANDAWFSVQQTLNGWTARNAAFVESAGSVGLEQQSKDDLPQGIGFVTFNARITQPIIFDDFAYYMDGQSSRNYAISAMITMSREKEWDTVKPTDMSPVRPSVSFVGYHRRKQGCYEFRMTRTSDTELTLALYKWTQADSTTEVELLTNETYVANLLVPQTDDEARYDRRTAAYFLVYTFPDGRVKLEGHLSTEHTQVGIGVAGTESGLSASAISYVDENPDVLARGGSYGVGSADCRAGFSAIRIHDVVAAPTEDITPVGDAVIDRGFLEYNRLEDDWDFYPSRWEVDSLSYDPNGGLSAVIPNQEVQVWVSDAGGDSGWCYSGYSVAVNSFSTNRYTISPHESGSWNVMLKTGENDPVGVVVDDVYWTPCQV